MQPVERNNHTQIYVYLKQIIEMAKVTDDNIKKDNGNEYIHSALIMSKTQIPLWVLAVGVPSHNVMLLR